MVNFPIDIKALMGVVVRCGDLEEGHQVGLRRRLELRLQPAGELLRLDLGVLEVEGVENHGERNTSSAVGIQMK